MINVLQWSAHSFSATCPDPSSVAVTVRNQMEFFLVGLKENNETEAHSSTWIDVESEMNNQIVFELKFHLLSYIGRSGYGTDFAND